jgi:hypothetical protein
MSKENRKACLAWAWVAAAFLAVPVKVTAKQLDRSTPAVASASGAAGQADRADRPVSLSLRETPLRTALEMLFDGTGLQHAVEPDVPNAPITLSIREIPFQTALRTLMRLAGNVTYQKDGEIYIVRMRRPVPEPAANAASEIVVGAPATEVVPHWEKVTLNYVHPAVVAVALNIPLLPSEVELALGGAGGYGGGVGGLGNGAYGGLNGGGAPGGFNGGGLGPGGVGNLSNGPFNGSGLGTMGSGINGAFGNNVPGLGVNGIVNGQGNNVLFGPRPRNF